MEQIVDNAEARRLELASDPRAHLVYKERPGRLLLVHTEVPEDLGGRGIAGDLVRAGLERARSAGAVVVPHCSYARSWIEKHSEDAAGVEIDWEG